MTKHLSIENILKRVKSVVKSCGGKNPQIGYTIKRGKDTHHGYPMNRVKPNKSLTIVIHVNGGAEDNEFAPRGCY